MPTDVERLAIEAPAALPAPGWLYDVVAIGMRAYVGNRFRVTAFGLDRLCLEPGTLIVATHRSDHDVPLLCGTLYFGSRLWRRRSVRAAFAVRDDLFEPGFFAGYPRRLPLALRRSLWRFNVGPALSRRLFCLPIRSATSMRLAQLLRQTPDYPVRRLPPDLLARIEARAPTPRIAVELVRPEYADLLWQVISRAGFDDPEFEEVWRRRAASALRDLRRLVGLLRAGGRLVLFPEGRPSPDGSIGPLMPGVSALVRRGRPKRLQPISLAYDPLGPGRPRAYVSVADPLAPSTEGLENALLGALRHAMPLTPGQLVARAALGKASLASADAEIEAALAQDRPVDPDLLGPRRGSRLRAAAAAAAKAPGRIARLAREAESAALSGA